METNSELANRAGLLPLVQWQRSQQCTGQVVMCAFQTLTLILAAQTSRWMMSRA